MAFKPPWISDCVRDRVAGMRRVDLYEATMAGWAQLDPSQRERFFRAGLKAALRLDRLEFRAWLLRRLRNPPPAASDDLMAFAISDADLALLLKQLPSGADDADRGTSEAASASPRAVRHDSRRLPPGG